MLSCSWLHHGLVFWQQAWNLGCLPALVDHDNALERDDDLAILVVAGGLHRHDADIRARPGLPLLQHLRLRVDGIAFEDRVGEPDLVPAQVGKDVLRNVGDALPGDQRERKGRVDEWLTKFSLCSVVVVKLRLPALERRGFWRTCHRFSSAVREDELLMVAHKTFGQTRSGTGKTHALGQDLPRIRALLLV